MCVEYISYAHFVAVFLKQKIERWMFLHLLPLIRRAEKMIAQIFAPLESRIEN